jgi:GAF domain-containing protein
MRSAMADQKLLTTTLSEFAATLVQGFAISDVLHDLAERVAAVVAVDSVGVYLRDDGALRFITALDEPSAAVERVQEQEQEGPCVDAWRSGSVITVTDLRENRQRWPAYVAAAGQAGILAVAGIPMYLGGQHIGVLDLHSKQRRDWSAEDLGAARVLADIAASYVINASRLDQQRRISEQLQEALERRVIIEQAKGILAAERGITVDKAFEVLRQHARQRGASLRAVADAVVNLGLRP